MKKLVSHLFVYLSVSCAAQSDSTNKFTIINQAGIDTTNLCIKQYTISNKKEFSDTTIVWDIKTKTSVSINKEGWNEFLVYNGNELIGSFGYMVEKNKLYPRKTRITITNGKNDSLIFKATTSLF